MVESRKRGGANDIVDVGSESSEEDGVLVRASEARRVVHRMYTASRQRGGQTSEGRMHLEN